MSGVRRTAIRRILLMAGLMAVLPAASWAEDAGTVLLLHEAVTASTPADQMEASVIEEATAVTAAAAQTAVNKRMAEAAAEAHRRGILLLNTSGYSVGRDMTDKGTPSGNWRARQTLTLKTPQPFEPLLDLLGDLQASPESCGHASCSAQLTGLSYGLSDAARQTLEGQLIAQAIARLRAKADIAAKAAGLAFKEFRRLQVDETRLPVPMAHRAMMAVAAAPPVAEGSDLDVHVTVEAEAVLVDRSQAMGEHHE